ncbi:MAG: ATP-dependent Clp protease adaptor ClpS [Candidatus Sericytochromatia bacterium]
MKDFEFESDNDVVLEDEEEIELKKPSMYRVIIHNDAYTPREFVVIILQTVFHKSEEEGKNYVRGTYKRNSNCRYIYL